MIEPKILSDEDLNRAYMGSDYHPSFKLTLEMKHSLERVAQTQNDYCYKEMVGQFIDLLAKHRKTVCKTSAGDGIEYDLVTIPWVDIQALQLEEG